MPMMSRVADGVIDAEEQLELGAGLLQVQSGGVVVGFELGELQVDALEVGAGDVSGVEAGLAEV